jgi:hypothetical protein
MVHIQAINEGTIHLIPQGKIVFFNILGKKVKEIEINLDGRKVLPGGIWRTSIPLSGLSMGYVRTELQLDYGITEQKIREKMVFWNFSNIFLLSIGFVFSILIFLFIWRKYKKV